MSAASEVRQFNRFYTRMMGLLAEHLPDSTMTLQEGRVLYELGTGRAQTAADIARTLDMDKAQLSRIVRRLRNQRLVRSQIDPAHARKQLLSLTAAGRERFAKLDRGSQKKVEALLAPLDAEARSQLVETMRGVQAAFGATLRADAPVVLRPLVPGDIGWVVHRQAVLYAQEYGWDWTYEGLIAKILGDYCCSFDHTKEDGWIAERDGLIVGSIFLMRSERSDTAKLRLLYVEPSARGLGVGRKLVDTCIARARALGYVNLTLWTNDVLVAARRIYQACGFRLLEEQRHHSFGKDLVGQTWELEL